MDFLLFLLIGGVAGWIAGILMKGSGSGLLINIVVGIVGGVLGGWLFRLIGLQATGLTGSLVTATVGAVALLFLARLVMKKK